MIGSLAQALASLELARSIWERLARENPSDTELRNRLGANYVNAGGVLSDMARFEEARNSAGTRPSHL